MDWYLFKKLNTLTYNFVELMATGKGRQLNCFHPRFVDLGSGMGKIRFRDKKNPGSAKPATLVGDMISIRHLYSVHERNSRGVFIA
jgi:hypothetical protein